MPATLIGPSYRPLLFLKSRDTILPSVLVVNTVNYLYKVSFSDFTVNVGAIDTCMLLEIYFISYTRYIIMVLASELKFC